MICLCVYVFEHTYYVVDLHWEALLKNSSVISFFWSRFFLARELAFTRSIKMGCNNLVDNEDFKTRTCLFCFQKKGTSWVKIWSTSENITEDMILFAVCSRVFKRRISHSSWITRTFMVFPAMFYLPQSALKLEGISRYLFVMCYLL